MLAACLLPGCSKSILKMPSLKMPKIPKLFGGKDKVEVDGEGGPDHKSNVPANRAAGVVHLVNDRGRFVLVKSLSGGRSNVTAGTIWMAYDSNGKPSAKLKVSAERKGAFVVADIVRGTPGRGDSVVLHGVMDKKGAVTTVTDPDGKKRQVLE